MNLGGYRTMNSVRPVNTTRLHRNGTATYARDINRTHADNNNIYTSQYSKSLMHVMTEYTLTHTHTQ